MIEVRQAENELPGNWFLDPSGHTSGLLSPHTCQTLYASKVAQARWARRAHRRFGSYLPENGVFAKFVPAWAGANELGQNSTFGS